MLARVCVAPFSDFQVKITNISKSSGGRSLGSWWWGLGKSELPWEQNFL